MHHKLQNLYLFGINMKVRTNSPLAVGLRMWPTLLCVQTDACDTEKQKQKDKFW